MKLGIQKKRKKQNKTKKNKKKKQLMNGYIKCPLSSHSVDDLGCSTQFQ